MTPKGTSGKRTTITRDQYFERLEKAFPGVSSRLEAFLQDLSFVNVSPEYGTDSLILRWRPPDGRNWNLATIPSSNGWVVTENLGLQTQGTALITEFKAYLQKLAGLVPKASVRETAKEAGWYVRLGKTYITVDALVANELRRQGWIDAIRDFQKEALEQVHGE